MSQRCPECDQVHKFSHKIRQAGRRCVYHDPDNKTDRRLVGHRGLPEDCPGCLGRGTIERSRYGKRAPDARLTCRDCRVTYYWSER